MIKREEEEKDRLLLVPSTCKVVEYLEPIMSKELLFKFPDNSAFDFDYSQSSIWSPLVPRSYYSPMDFDWEDVSPRKLVFGLEPPGSGKKGRRSCFKNVNSSIRTKKRRSFGVGTSPALDFDMDVSKSRPGKKSKAKGAPCDLSPDMLKGAKCVPFPSKGWKKVLKAASKHFKKKKKNSASHVKLSNYLTHYGN